ncbi:MAG: hypothetical protein ACKVS8_06740 [Phycisphaerales bacterium]
MMTRFPAARSRSVSSPALRAARSFVAFVALGAALLAAVPALAAEPYAAVVARDDTPLRSGPAVLHYPVANLKRDTLVMVDGEESGFLRVAYPAGVKAFVKAEDLAGEPRAGEAAKLQKGSRLRAANATAGDRGSWYPLLEKELAAGADLKVLDVVKGDDGKTTMYAVAAPAEARGWINKELVRRATPEEAAKVAPAVLPSAPAATTTGPGAPGTPPAPGTFVPTSGGTVNPPSITVPAKVSVLPEQASPAPVAAPPAPAKPSPIEGLVAMYERVRQQPLNEAELEPAVAAFNAEIARSDSRTAKYLQRYVDVMQIRLDLRGDVKNAAATKASIEAQQISIAKQVEELDKNAIYKAIGRLMPSTVYDGIRLPKLYRLVTAEPGNARTIGYLQPDASLDLDNKLNRVVGVIGESRIDESLRAMLLTPSRVDLLNITPTVMSTPDVAPAPPDMNK